MQHEGVMPDKCSFVSALSACTKEKTLAEGKQIHHQATALGFDTDVRVGTSLLEMYRKCGDIDDVQRTFSKMQDRDVFSWTAMISAHAKHGQSKVSVALFQQMLQESVFPDEVIFASALSSYDCQNLLCNGKQMHACIIGSRCESDVVVGTAVINMYGRCGSIQSAHSMFKKLPKRDVISWNSMLAMYVKHGLPKDALQLYKEMLQEGVKPDQATFVSLLDACSSQDSLAEGKKMHDDIVAKGFDSDILVSTSLVNMYSRCGSLQHAWTVFDNMTRHDVVSWNVMIDTCAQHEQGTDAFRLFGDMQQNGVMPNKVTFLNVLQACTDETGISEGNQIHSLIVISGLELDVVVATALVTMYGKCDSLEDAWKLFSKIPERNLVSWNAMIAAYAQQGQAEKAFRLYEQMQVEGEMPNKVTFLSMLSLPESKVALMEGKRLHSYLLSNRLDMDVTLANALICMYGKCGNVVDARAIFNGMSERDVVSWTAMMSVYSQQGLHKGCHLLFEQMQQQGITLDKTAFVIMTTAYSNPATLSEGKLIHSHIANSDLELNVDIANGLINMYGKCGSLEDALRTFDRMYTRNKQTFINSLSVCASLVALSNGKQIHCQMVADNLLLDALLGNTLINMYGKCGCVDDAQRVFDRMQDRDVVSWSTMVTTYAQHGQGRVALMLFERMQCEKVWPNEVTFLGVLSACNHTGLVDDGCYHFISMSQDYGISPTEDHYNCVIDLLSRSGRLEEAEDMILKMPSESRCLPWTTLLGACVCRADVARAERAARDVFELDPKNPVPYVMLANIYATAGREDNAAKVIKSMKERVFNDVSNCDLFEMKTKHMKFL